MTIMFSKQYYVYVFAKDLTIQGTKKRAIRPDRKHNNDDTL